jgi:glycine/D-amino acid oxidase-like deaminating enzyme
VSGRVTRRAFLGGAVAGGAAMWAGAVLPRRLFESDAERPPALYEWYVDGYWLDSAGVWDGNPVREPLRGRQRADVAIVGGGFCGMATAWHLAELLPGRRIVLLEGARCGYGASGRNGGFADPGMPGLDWVWREHGPEAARAWYDATLGGLDQIRSFVREHGVDCELEENGSLQLAAEEEDLEDLAEWQRHYHELGVPAEMVEGAALRRTLHTERFAGALQLPEHCIINPAKLALGMRGAVESRGVVVSERSRVLRIEPGRPVRIRTEFAEVEAAQAVVALNGYAPQIGLLANRILPLCNYVCATEPLSKSQWEAIGWSGRESLSDTRVLFMYLRPTTDGRIVFGGESAPYFYGGRPSSGNYRPAVERLQQSLLETFPQLEGIRFTHAWGGTMGFTADFVPSVGRLFGAPNLFYAGGFNGEGVVMTQVAGRILAELVAGVESPLTKLPLVGKQMPWLPPEPFRYAAVKLYEQALLRLGTNPLR